MAAMALLLYSTYTRAYESIQGLWDLQILNGA